MYKMCPYQLSSNVLEWIDDIAQHSPSHITVVQSFAAHKQFDENALGLDFLTDFVGVVHNLVKFKVFDEKAHEIIWSFSRK